METLQCMRVWGSNQAFDTELSAGGLDLRLICRPFERAEAGGDVTYISACATGRISRLLVADVSGHGAEVAGVADQLRILMERSVNRIDPRKLVEEMNERFTELAESQVFATAVVLSYFAPTRHLSICNAGHPAPLLYRAGTGRWEALAQKPRAGTRVDLPLGFLEGVSYSCLRFRMKRGDRVLVYTDSLFEAKDPAGEPLHLPGLCKAVGSLDPSDSGKLVPALLDRIESLDEGNLADDDVTAICLGSNDEGVEPGVFPRLLAPWRIGGRALLAVLGRGSFAWPEWTLANVGGTFLAALNRRWRGPDGSVEWTEE